MTRHPAAPRRAPLARLALLGPLLPALLTGCSSSGAPAVATSHGPGPLAGQASASATPSVDPPGGSVAPVPVESNPPGDIPDNVAYVTYTNAVARYGFAHPEGWVSSGSGGSVTFADKLNGIAAEPVSSATVPTSASAQQVDVPRLRHRETAFELRSVMTVALRAGTGVLIVYRRNSAPDPVTGKVFRDEVLRYELVGHAHRLDLELYGPVGADNVDPYAKITQSLTIA